MLLLPSPRQRWTSGWAAAARLSWWGLRMTLALRDRRDRGERSRRRRLSLALLCSSVGRNKGIYSALPVLARIICRIPLRIVHVLLCTGLHLVNGSTLRRLLRPNPRCRDDDKNESQAPPTHPPHIFWPETAGASARYG